MAQNVFPDTLDARFFSDVQSILLKILVGIISYSIMTWVAGNSEKRREWGFTNKRVFRNLLV